MSDAHADAADGPSTTATDDVATGSGGSSASGLADQMATRRAKADAMRARGLDPHPPVWPVTHSVARVREEWGDLEPGVETGVEVTVAGRLVTRRGQGKLAFGVIRDDGADIQLFVQVNALGEEGMAVFSDVADVGDWLGVVGEVMATRRGELSIRPSRLVVLGKSLRPLPDQYYGLADVETRSRQRELDLIVNESTRRTFALRARVLQSLREEMVSRGFVEVETPMLHPIPGGAAARPFVTHHNTLDTDLYLRIAPELYLKRLVIGGMARVFEMNRNFRNEGMSTKHNPEFTMLESYQAYGDHEDGMELAEALIRRAAVDALGTDQLTYQGRDVSLAVPFPRRPMLEMVRQACGVDVSYDDVDRLRTVCRLNEVEFDPSWGPGRMVNALFEELVEPELWQPVFVTEYPVEISPLARRHRDPAKPHVTERFEVFVTGREFGNGFSDTASPKFA